MTESLNRKKTAIITGANSGIGFEAAKILADKGYKVVLAVRNMEKGRNAASEIQRLIPAAELDVRKLDLADLESVHQFADHLVDDYSSLGILINNAGVMVPPYQKTRDGFELQFGSNHLGHFALTGLLLPLLKASGSSRVVTLSSLAHKGAVIDFTNLDGSSGYKPMKFYGQSKLSNLLFSKELDQRFKEHQLAVKSIACHPGISATNLFKIGGRDAPGILKKMSSLFLQPAEMGALPTVFAALNEDLQGGEYIGPDGKGARKGYPAIEIPAQGVYNQEIMSRLWDVSEQLTHVTYDFSS
ncbi:oxidoreductase [Peribacillus kribbensis]|uniref:oxidoreductase n=1 Tax=Peribacillus kribbensis TaxID=356658 RepID=UPI00047EBFCD|nr:oxidoreductase [Peribacillus kribbensis]